MKSIAAALAAAALALPVHAQIADWKKAQHIDVTMTNHGFVPRRIMLRQGAAYVVRFANRSHDAHNFVAKAFFDNARVDPRDGGLVAHDEIDLDAGASATVRLVAPTTPHARYEFHSSRLADATRDLKGDIFVR